MNSLELKIKSKHLALESSVIRFEENKLKRQIRWQADRGTIDPPLVNSLNNIHNHRVLDVRWESRATHLARAFLNDVPYVKLESKRAKDKEFVFRVQIIPRTYAMIRKYGNGKFHNLTVDQLKEWATVSK